MITFQRSSTNARCEPCDIGFGFLLKDGVLCCPVCRRQWPGPVYPICMSHLYYCTNCDLKFGFEPGKPVKCYLCRSELTVVVPAQAVA